MYDEDELPDEKLKRSILIALFASIVVTGGYLAYMYITDQTPAAPVQETSSVDRAREEQLIAQTIEAFSASVPERVTNDEPQTEPSQTQSGTGTVPRPQPEQQPQQQGPQRSEAEQALYEQRLRIIAEEEAWAAEMRRRSRETVFQTPEMVENWNRIQARMEARRLEEQAREDAAAERALEERRLALAELQARSGAQSGDAAWAHQYPATPPEGWHNLRIGTRIPAALVDEIRSELPGQIRAMITRDVYDSATFQTVLIPAGTQLIGSYGNDTSPTQGRLFIYWERLLFNDGREVALNTAPSTDASGASGLAGRRNSSFTSIFFQSVLLNMANNVGNQSGSSTDLSDAARIATGQSTASITEQYLAQRIERGARFTIPRGTQLNIVVEETIALPAVNTRR